MPGVGGESAVVVLAQPFGDTASHFELFGEPGCVLCAFDAVAVPRLEKFGDVGLGAFKSRIMFAATACGNGVGVEVQFAAVAVLALLWMGLSVVGSISIELR
ncbi:hypothetical protein ACQ856_28635 (plasmid) [Mycolicibacterium psychrotolerans]|uniref:hypothetical protein n=1 Tax=Mycolicibacterium psychrotolerans TaxID=216929 RepID=UPI003D66D7BB